MLMPKIIADVTNGTKAEICQKSSVPVFSPVFDIEKIPRPIKKRQIINRKN